MPVTGVLMARISPARLLAFRALQEVENGAFASDTLRELTERSDTRDAGLASQIVFGCLRHQGQLDHLIQHYSGRSPAQLDPEVKTVLRMGIYQIRYLDRIPAHAAVNDAVELIKRVKRPAAGLVNAVVRKVNKDPVQWPDDATRLSCPAWLLNRWREHFGGEQAQAIAQAALQEPVPYIRMRPGEQPSPDLTLEPTDVSGAFRLLSPAARSMRLHDISSQAIVPLLELKPEHRFLDLCAAPGNKTLQALESTPKVAIACDVSFRRIRNIPPVCPRVVLDATAELPFRGQFARIFVDAPCSGTGTLARNPEIKWRVESSDFEKFGERQIAILSRALSVLKPGGRLLYATCSLEREENEDVISTTLEANDGLRCEKQVWRVPGRDAGDGFFAAVLSW